MNRRIASILTAAALIAGWAAAARTARAAQTAPVPEGQVASPQIAKPNDGALDLYFCGKRMAQLEPCGCHTKQKGGVQYEASLYGQHPGRPSIRVDAGGWMFPMLQNSPLAKLSGGQLLLALRAMGLDAVNVSAYDLDLGKAALLNLEKEHPGLMQIIVSANVYDAQKPGQRAFAAYRIVERQLAGGRKVKIGVVGATTLNLSGDGAPAQLAVGEYLVKPPLPELQAVVAELRPKVDMLVVLYYAVKRPDEFMALPEAVPGIDAIVTTTDLPDAGAMAMRNGRTSILRVFTTQGKELGIASFKPSPMTGGWTLAGLPESLYVSNDLPVSAPLQKIVNDFKAKTSGLAVLEPAKGVKRAYAGDSNCVACHAEISASWKKTRHARAMQSLIDQQQQFNPDCVKCHVTGYQRENGFYSVKLTNSKEMMNVQCEQCHGPANAHAEAMRPILAKADRWTSKEQYKALLDQARKTIPSAAVPESTCVECHQGDNDPNFSYEKKVRLVNHGELAEKDRQAPAELIKALGLDVKK